MPDISAIVDRIASNSRSALDEELRRTVSVAVNQAARDANVNLSAMAEDQRKRFLQYVIESRPELQRQLNTVLSDPRFRAELRAIVREQTETIGSIVLPWAAGIVAFFTMVPVFRWGLDRRERARAATAPLSP